MTDLFAKAYAKVNLSLDVVGKREDGYHELSGVMQQISLADDLFAAPSEEISIRCNLPYIPCDQRNILWKSAKAFFEYTDIRGKGVSFTLHKRIPSGAGLGGGSSDGVAALKLLNKMYGTHLSDEQLIEIATPVGADMPFFVRGGSALARGIGEKLVQLSPLTKGAFLLLKPPFSLPTPKIFSLMDELESYPHPDATLMANAVEKQDVAEIGARMGNSMQIAVEKEHPEIVVFCDQLKKAGALGAIMSGSGSTVYGIFESVPKAKKAALSFIGKQCDCYVVTPKE